MSEHKSEVSKTAREQGEQIVQNLEVFLGDGQLDPQEINTLANQLSDISDDKRPQVIEETLSLVQQQIVMTSGPIPPPEIVAGYEQILPGSADRLFSMAESQAEHRQTLEKVGLNAAIHREKQGMWIAASLATLFGLLGAGLIYTGNGTTGLAIILTELIGLGALFIGTERSAKKELRGKMRQSEPEQEE